jgi:hypothetical protein
MNKFVLAALIGATVSASDIAGLGASVSQEGINSLTTIITPYIF